MKQCCLLLLVIFLGACKKSDTASNNSADRTTIELKKVDESKLATRLFEYYIPNPSVLGHHEENLIIDYAIENNLNLTRSNSGLYYMTTKKGTGPLLNKTENLSVDYKGSFLDGKNFDSSYDRGEPIVFKIGEMIAGWNEGLTYLKHGDEAILIVPSRLGYGESGFPNFVPPNTILRFDMKVH